MDTELNSLDISLSSGENSRREEIPKPALVTAIEAASKKVCVIANEDQKMQLISYYTKAVGCCFNTCPFDVDDPHINLHAETKVFNVPINNDFFFKNRFYFQLLEKGCIYLKM